MISLRMVGDIVAHRSLSHAVNTMCPVIPIGASFSAAKGARSCSSAAASAVTVGNSKWLSTTARPWPGICLTMPTTPPARSPSTTARPSAATRIGSLPKARSPMASCVSGTRTSSSGRQSTVMPTSASMRPSASPLARAASMADMGATS